MYEYKTGEKYKPDISLLQVFACLDRGWGGDPDSPQGRVGQALLELGQQPGEDIAPRCWPGLSERAMQAQGQGHQC